MVYPAEQGLKLQILAVALLVVLIFLHYLLWIDESGTRQMRALRIAITVQKDNNLTLSERNKGLDAEIKDLKSGLTAIEERARAEIGMIRPDETFYRLLEQPLSQPVTSDKSATPVKPGATAHKPLPATAKPLAPTAVKTAPAPAKPLIKPAAPSAKPKPAPNTGTP